MRQNIESVQHGWTVYGLDDEKIGEVADIGANYVLVQKGLIFTKDIFIPTTAITAVQPEDQSLTINASKHDVETYDWQMAPDVSSTGTAGYAPSDTTGYATDETAFARDETTTYDSDRSRVGDQDRVRVGQGAGDLVGAGADRIEATRFEDEDELAENRERDTRSW